MTAAPFDDEYYEAAGLADDRIALWWYARIIRRLRPQGGRLLELGCGTGHLLKRLTPHFEACGFDVSPAARAVCRRVAPAAQLFDDWEGLPAASFDLIVSLHTLEHVREPFSAIERVASLLRPGAPFFFVVPNPEGWGHQLKRERWFAYRDPTHCSLLRRGEWEILLRRAGLTVVSVRGDGLWDAPYIPLLPTALQRLVFGAPAALQVFSPLARPFLPAVMGECLVVTAQKPHTPL
jgi:SAM-dependent methyltransferase